MPRKFPFFFQLDGMDCGHPCLKMIAEFYGKTIELQLLRDYSYFVKDGVSLLGISQVANKLNTTSNKQYTVECSNGSNGWTKVCDGKLSCASLIKAGSFFKNCSQPQKIASNTVAKALKHWFFSIFFNFFNFACFALGNLDIFFPIFFRVFAFSRFFSRF